MTVNSGKLSDSVSSSEKLPANFFSFLCLCQYSMTYMGFKSETRSNRVLFVSETNKGTKISTNVYFQSENNSDGTWAGYKVTALGPTSRCTLRKCFSPSEFPQMMEAVTSMLNHFPEFTY